jgi:pentatricopeptide repeat protein
VCGAAAARHGAARLGRCAGEQLAGAGASGLGPQELVAGWSAAPERGMGAALRQVRGAGSRRRAGSPERLAAPGSGAVGGVSRCEGARALARGHEQALAQGGTAGGAGARARRRARRRSCGGGLLREMRECSGSQYTYATVISGWCTIGRIEDASSLAREMHEGRRAGRRGGEAKATVIARRAQKEQLRSGKAVRTGVTRRGFDAQCKTGGEVAGPGGPSGIEPARSRVRAGVFCRRPTCFVSTGACVCKATDHARAS